MAEFKKFNYKTLQDLKDDIERLGVDIPTTEDLSPLSKPVKIGEHTAPNAFCVLPMEGFDCLPDGSPSDLTYRRYMRYGAGGSGLIWFEACSVNEGGKSNPACMVLQDKSFDATKKMISGINKAAHESLGFKPVKILQLTHSGRQSRPYGDSKPVITKNCPVFDARFGIDADYPTITDEQLDAMIPDYVKAAKLAKEAGFEGVDIKSCHRYLISELMSSYDRPGKYGGSLENRASFFLNIVREVRKATGPDFIIGTRISLYDGHPYPIGFGASEKNGHPDLEEPMKFVDMMVSAGVDFLSSSGGDGFNTPWVIRQFNMPVIGGKTPQEHPLEGIARMLELTRKLQGAAGKIPVIGNCYSWLREFLPNVGAAVLARGEASFIGFGRGAFAYPDMPKDTFAGKIDRKKCCITCSKCVQIMHDGGRNGCPIRDTELYLPIYKENRKAAIARTGA